MNKWLLYGLVGYSLIISVLLTTKGCERSPQTDTPHLEREADSLRVANSILEDNNKHWKLRYDSVGVRLDRIDLSLVQIREDKDEVQKRYKARFVDLDNLSEDSLKIVALEK
jgi:hypothetical protein